MVNWDTVCRSKRCGGLGIRKAGAPNRALLSKLGWRVSTEHDPPWIQLLHNKYLKGHTLRNWPAHKKASHACVDQVS